MRVEALSWQIEGSCVATLPEADLDRDDPQSVAAWAAYRKIVDLPFDDVVRTKKLCEECPVRVSCEALGRRTKKAFSEMSAPGVTSLTLAGVWGGLAASEL